MKNTGAGIVMAKHAKILVVDDDERVRQFLKDLLKEADYEVDLVPDGAQALKRIETEPPDLVLLDVIMPGMGGLEVLRFLKSPQQPGFLPVIILTGDTDMDKRLKGLKLGADDYLTKPVNANEVMARIKALLRIKKLQDQMASSRKRLADESITDPVTGLYNTRFLRMRLKDEFKRAERYNEPLSWISILVEGWDELSGELPEDLLEGIKRDIAGVVRAGVREFDIVVQSDDDKYTILLPRTHFAGSMAVAGRLWKSLIATRTQWPAQAKELLLTIGVAFYPDKDVATARQLEQKVDTALEKARKEGKGQICLYQQTAYFFQPDQGE